MIIDPRDIETVFLEAMSIGWASEDPIIGSIPGFPGMKQFSHVNGRFKVIDSYFVAPGSIKSAGSTVIWHDESPIWAMYYGGQYEEAVMSFLKTCLLQAYRYDALFYGGRGRAFYQKGRFIYVNCVEQGGFDEFHGRELIFDESGAVLGSYHYRGMSLIENF